MVKLFQLVHGRPGVSPGDLAARWLVDLAPAASRVPGVRRYVFATAVEGPTPVQAPSAIAALEQTWFDTAQAAADALRELAAVPGRDALVDAAASPWLVTTEHEIFGDPPQAADDPAIVATALFRRLPGQGTVEFRSHWLDVHAPLVGRSPGITRYVQCHVEASGSGEPPVFDGVAEGWFRDRAGLEAFFASPQVLEEQGEDVKHFIDAASFELFVSDREHRVLW